MKLTEKELNEFPLGTKITIEENEYKYKYEYIKTIIGWANIYFVEAKNLALRNIIKVEIPVYAKWTKPEPILDDKERKYLSAVIKPWKDKVVSIMKNFEYQNGCYEYITICYDRESYIHLPSFKEGTMYKEMELARKYSLEELGL